MSFRHAGCQVYGISWYITKSHHLQSLRVTKIQEVLGQFCNVEVAFTSRAIVAIHGFSRTSHGQRNWFPWNGMHLVDFFPHDNFNNKTMVHDGSLWGNHGSASACNWGAVPRHLPKTGLVSQSKKTTSMDWFQGKHCSALVTLVTYV